jgi:hypothetical protein
MIMHVLVNWGVLQALYIQNSEDFSLEDDERVQLFRILFRVQLFRILFFVTALQILFRVQIFLRISQTTHLCDGVCILLELLYLLHTTLRCDTDLQIFDPRKEAAKNLDIYDESRYTKEDKRLPSWRPWWK